MAVSDESRAALVAEEVARVDAFFKANPRAKMHPFDTTTDYVEAVYDAHKTLIERWGGWRRTGEPPAEQPLVVLTDEDLRNILYKVHDEFYAVFADRWSYSRSTKPSQIANNLTLYRSKLFDPQGEARDMEYLQGKTCKIRKGQSVAKAVLRAVTVDYPDNPALHRAMARLFELLGQSWAGGTDTVTILTCAPSSFLKMGHYGCDGGSCFKTGGVSERTKVNTSLLSDSVVVLFYRGECTAPQTWADREVERGPYCRMYGVMAEKGLMVSNIQGVCEWARMMRHLIPVVEQDLGLQGCTYEGTTNYKGKETKPGASSSYYSSYATNPYRIDYWEINNLIASDSNQHMIAEAEHLTKFREVYASMMAFKRPTKPKVEPAAPAAVVEEPVAKKPRVRKAAVKKKPDIAPAVEPKVRKPRVRKAPLLKAAA
jgi:hypothetical protein